MWRCNRREGENVIHQKFYFKSTELFGYVCIQLHRANKKLYSALDFKSNLDNMLTIFLN